jgi:hypothetical protein
MRRWVLAGALALAAGGQGLASDLPPPAAPPPPRAPAAKPRGDRSSIAFVRERLDDADGRQTGVIHAPSKASELRSRLCRPTPPIWAFPSAPTTLSRRPRSMTGPGSMSSATLAGGCRLIPSAKTASRPAVSILRARAICGRPASSAAPRSGPITNSPHGLSVWKAPGPIRRSPGRP